MPSPGGGDLSPPILRSASPDPRPSPPLLNRRVQWPTELAAGHSVSISMTPPADGLDKASTIDWDLDEGVNPFGDEKRAEQVTHVENAETVEEGRIAAARDQIATFVDPGETEGMPRVAADGEVVTLGAEGKAKDLVVAHATGSFGFLRRRNGAGGFTSGQGENTGEDDDDAREVDLPLTAATTDGGGGGILSALIALSAQGDTGSTNPSPGSSGAVTPDSRSGANTPYESDDSDDEAERERFVARLRAHRASKNAFHATSSAFVGAGKSVAGAAYHLATGTNRPRSIGEVSSQSHRSFTRSVSTSNLAYEAGKAPLPSPGLSPPLRAHSSASLNAYFTPSSPPQRASSPPPRSLSSTALHHLIATSSRASSPSPPPSPGLHVPRSPKVSDSVHRTMRKLGNTLGFEIDTEKTRPQAARNGAGVFGGLVMSTASLAAPAAPHSSSLGPSPTRPGYHLSRYSAPSVPTANSPRKSVEVSRGRRSVEVPRERPASLAEMAENEQDDDEVLTMPSRSKAGSNLRLKDLPTNSGFKFNGLHSPNSRDSSPRRESPLREYFFLDRNGATKSPHHHHQQETEEERDQREWIKEKKRRAKLKEKRRKQKVFITVHIAELLARQDFLLKLARALMMYGAPTHRIEAQVQAAARVLEVNCQAMYLPSLLLVAFGDAGTHTSDIKFLKQANGLDLGKMRDTFVIYNKVVRDKIGVEDASLALDELFLQPPKYKLWQHLIIGAFAGAFIMPIGFYGSFIDCIAAMPLGAMLVFVQVALSRNDLYSSLFEIVIACTSAILAACLARSEQICFPSVAAGAVVLILPGYIVLGGALELANRSIISGSVRMVYAVLYSLFLGFGLSMGSEIYIRISGSDIIGAADFTCSALRLDAPWWRATIPKPVFVLLVPGFLLSLGMRVGQPLYRRETVVMVLIGGAGFSANFFASRAFVNRPDVNCAIGAFVVGLLGNIYNKITRESAFVVMVVGIFIQLPSGLLNGGLLKFAYDNTEGSSTSFSTGLWAASTLVQIAIGLTVGLFVAAAVMNAFGGGRRRGLNLSSF